MSEYQEVPNCALCGKPAYSWRPRVVTSRPGRDEKEVYHSRCYHMQRDAEWIKTNLDGTERKMTAEEIDAHVKWADEMYPESSI